MGDSYTHSDSFGDIPHNFFDTNAWNLQQGYIKADQSRKQAIHDCGKPYDILIFPICFTQVTLNLSDPPTVVTSSLIHSTSECVVIYVYYH